MHFKQAADIRGSNDTLCTLEGEELLGLLAAGYFSLRDFQNSAQINESLLSIQEVLGSSAAKKGTTMFNYAVSLNNIGQRDTQALQILESCLLLQSAGSPSYVKCLDLIAKIRDGMNDPSASFRKGEEFFQMNLFRDAVVHFETCAGTKQVNRSMKSNSGFVVLFKLCSCYFSLQNYPRVISIAEDVIGNILPALGELNTLNHANMLVFLGGSCYYLKNFIKALPIFEQTVSIFYHLKMNETEQYANQLMFLGMKKIFQLENLN